MRRQPSLTTMFPSGKLGARGHFPNYYRASAGEYFVNWVPSFLLAQRPCSSSVFLTAPVFCFMSFLLMAYACPWTQDIFIVCHLHLVTFPLSNTAIYHSYWDYIGPGYIIKLKSKSFLSMKGKRGEHRVLEQAPMNFWAGSHVVVSGIRESQAMVWVGC